MKRKYIKPEMNVVFLRQQSCLLEGSIQKPLYYQEEEEVDDDEDDFYQY